MTWEDRRIAVSQRKLLRELKKATVTIHLYYKTLEEVVDAAQTIYVLDDGNTRWTKLALDTAHTINNYLNEDYLKECDFLSQLIGEIERIVNE